MKKNAIIGCLALVGILALVSPSTLQELEWQKYGGYDVPFVPTPPEVVEEMLRLCDLKSGDLLYDLGCGDGRIVIAAAKNYGIKAIGIDIDPIRITESKANAANEGVVDKVRFIQQNLFETDFKDATVITMFLLTSVNRKLRPKLLAELRPGTRLVSHSFGMGDWKPDKTSVVKSTYDNVYLWVVPANLTGRWEWDFVNGSSKRRCALQITQQFQELSASGTAGDLPIIMNDAVLSGDDVRFRVDTEADGEKTSFRYQGKILGNRITGTITSANNSKAASVRWEASRDPGTVVPLDAGL